MYRSSHKEQKNCRPSQPPVPRPLSGHEKTAPQLGVPPLPGQLRVGTGPPSPKKGLGSGTHGCLQNRLSLLMPLDKTASSNKLHVPTACWGLLCWALRLRGYPACPLLASLLKSCVVCQTHWAPTDSVLTPQGPLFCTLSQRGNADPALGLSWKEGMPLRKELWSVRPLANSLCIPLNSKKQAKL